MIVRFNYFYLTVREVFDIFSGPQHPEINHEFDIWHLSKSKGLIKIMKTLEKKYAYVYLWKSIIINNHLWWLAQK